MPLKRVNKIVIFLAALVNRIILSSIHSSINWVPKRYPLFHIFGALYNMLGIIFLIHLIWNNSQFSVCFKEESDRGLSAKNERMNNQRSTLFLRWSLQWWQHNEIFRKPRINIWIPYGHWIHWFCWVTYKESKFLEFP